MISVTAAIFLEDNTVLIAQRDQKDPLAGKWEFPGGKIEQGETPEECLIREIREEFGVDIAVTGFFAKSVHRYETGAIELLAYHVVRQSGPFKLNAHAAVRWVPLDHLHQFSFAPADVPIVQKLRKEYKPKPN